MSGCSLNSLLSRVFSSLTVVALTVSSDNEFQAFTTLVLESVCLGPIVRCIIMFLTVASCCSSVFKEHLLRLTQQAFTMLGD